jgi:hypothetical protein
VAVLAIEHGEGATNMTRTHFLKRPLLALALAAVITASVFGVRVARASDDLAAPGDPASQCWTLPDGTVKCKACIYADGIKHCFVYTKKAPAPRLPGEDAPSGFSVSPQSTTTR